MQNWLGRRGSKDNAEVEKVASLEDIKSELEEVEDYLDKSRERQRRLRWWSHRATVAIVIVFAIYAAAFYKMPGGNGIDVLQNIKKSKPAPIVIMLTNYPYLQYRKKCMKAGAEYFFDKASEFEKVNEVLENLILSR